MAEAVDPGLMDPSSAAERRLQQQLEVREGPMGHVQHVLRMICKRKARAAGV
jgi:hypothetical protein